LVNIGRTAKCRTDFIDGSGFVTLEGQQFKATSLEDSPLKKGECVKVVGQKKDVVEVSRSVD
jgi:membrane-bound ClpP family serine protease